MQYFYVYILKCSDNSYYTGHTDNMELRLNEHMSSSIKSYTSNKLPVECVYVETFTSRDEAICAERKIKGWSRKKKEFLIKQDWKELENYKYKFNYIKPRILRSSLRQRLRRTGKLDL